MKNSIVLSYGKVAETAINSNYWACLDAVEQQNALKFKDLHRQAHYVEVHARKRLLLSEYLGIQPDAIAIAKAEHGKPYLMDYPEWAFNLSHSGGVWALVVAENCRLGVDLEQCKRRNNLSGLVGKCFGTEEIEYWEALPELKKVQEFFKLWTRKEAFVKATGRGIALGLDQCVFNPWQAGNFLRIPEEYGKVSDWQCTDVDLIDDFCCAVVNNNGPKTVHVQKIK